MLDKKHLRELSSSLVSEPDDYMHSLRKNIDLYISQKEITLTEVAEEADMSLNTLKSLLYGDSKDCNISTVIALARVFNVSVDELVGSGTISPQTTESLQLVRQLPESFTHFVRWAIHYHYTMLKSAKVSEKSVELMLAEQADNGNLKMTNVFDVVDISTLPDDIRTKIFMGLRIPCDYYAPICFENDILYMANDREAKPNEFAVICVGDNMWLVRLKKERHPERPDVIVSNYYSVRDGRLFARENEVQYVLGYVVKIDRNTETE